MSNVLAGAHLKVYVNGMVLGWTSGVQAQMRTPVKMVYGVDSSVASESIPTTYSVGGSLTIYRGKYQGGAEGLGMAAFPTKMLQQKYLTIELVDRSTGAIVMKFGNCLVTGQTWSVQPKGLIVGNISFEGTEFSSDAE